MTPAAYGQILSLARRHARRASEAEDVLQEALLAAVAAGRADLHKADNRRWLAGVIRRQAAFTARGAGRRLRRETAWQDTQDTASPAESATDLSAALNGLAPSLRLVAALALSGHTRREIAYLLRLNDTALRQRISQLKRQMRGRGLNPDGLPGLKLELRYGRIRDALLPQLKRENGLFASHDPDGHLFVVRRA